MTKRITERIHLDLSKGTFNRIKNWAIGLPHGPINDNLVLQLMDAQEDYLKRVKEKYRVKNPKPKLGKREPIVEVLNEWLDLNSQFGKEEDEGLNRTH